MLSDRASGPKNLLNLRKERKKLGNRALWMAQRLQVFSLHQAISLITQLQTEQRNCSMKSPLVVFAWNDNLQALISLWHMVAHHWFILTVFWLTYSTLYLHSHLSVASFPHSQSPFLLKPWKNTLCWINWFCLGDHLHIYPHYMEDPTMCIAPAAWHWREEEQGLDGDKRLINPKLIMSCTLVRTFHH